MDFDSLYLRAIKFLSFRPRSEKEISDYLKKKPSSRKGVEVSDEIEIENLIGLVVHKLRQQGFLNDAEFAKMWIRSRTEFKPKGERLIRLELEKKGISKGLIDEALESFNDTKERSEGKRSDIVLAVQLLEKRKRKYEGMEKQERFNKAGSMLARRGFDFDDVKAAIDQVFGKMV